jgi:hypothetical protein
MERITTFASIRLSDGMGWGLNRLSFWDFGSHLESAQLVLRFPNSCRGHIKVSVAGFAMSHQIVVREGAQFCKIYAQSCSGSDAMSETGDKCPLPRG